MDCYDDFDGDVDDESKSSYLNGANHGESYIDADISSVSRPAEQNGVVLRRKKIGSTAIKRRSGNRRYVKHFLCFFLFFNLFFLKITNKT